MKSVYYRATNKCKNPKSVEYPQQYSFSLGTGMDIGLSYFPHHLAQQAASTLLNLIAKLKPWKLIEWKMPSQQAQKLMLQLQTLDSCRLEWPKSLLCFLPKISQVCKKAVEGKNILPYLWSLCLKKTEGRCVILSYYIKNLKEIVGQHLQNHLQTSLMSLSLSALKSIKLVEIELQASPDEQQFARAHPNRLSDLTASSTATKLPRHHHSVEHFLQPSLHPHFAFNQRRDTKIPPTLAGSSPMIPQFFINKKTSFCVCGAWPISWDWLIQVTARLVFCERLSALMPNTDGKNCKLWVQHLLKTLKSI